MKKIPIDRLRPGVKLARSIVSAEGHVLLAAGVRIKPSFVERLRELGYTSVFIHETGFEDIPSPELISEQTRQEAIRSVRETFFHARNRHAIDPRWVVAAARSIVEEVLNERDILIHLGEVRGHDDYTFSHSVNVGVLCALIGRGMGYTRGQIRELAIGGLLHDVGKIFIPSEILNKVEPLTEGEVELIRAHPQDGFQLLRATPGIPLRSAHMAYQHHELYDGSGYPRGLKGDEIHVYGRINAVADAFDAMTADRPYRKGMNPLQVVRALEEVSGQRYDLRVVNVLRGYVAPYPVGARVRLNTGDLAVVVAVRRRALDRPRIRLVETAERPLPAPFQEIDLEERRDLTIVEIHEP